MRSISFPNIFNTASTNVVTDSHKATFQNILLVLGAEKGEFVGDPYFGIRLRRYIFDQNNYVLKDIIIDEIYTQLMVFMPQLIVHRNDIELVADKAKLSCSIKVTNREDFTVDTYNLVLFNGEGE